jgi:hypothetical protein
MSLHYRGLILIAAALVGCGGVANPAGDLNRAGAGGLADASGASKDNAGQSGFGESGGGVPSAGSGGQSVSVGIPAEPSDCQAFGISYLEGCAQCPADPIDCPCFKVTYQGAPLVLQEPIARCASGHCVLGADCAEICKNVPDPSSPEFSRDVPYFINLFSCVGAGVCLSDGWCPNHGKCLAEIPPLFGFCASGLNQALCQHADDCESGNCIPDASGDWRCSDGKSFSNCRDGGDCASGLCVMYGAPVGQCSSGELNDPCQEGDCKPGSFCAPDAIVLNLGKCVAGVSGDLCASGAGCQSGRCVLHDPGRRGLCSMGAENEPCNSNQECLSQQCGSPKPAEQGLCSGKIFPGSACGDNGVCDGEGLCEYGKCAAAP